MATTGIDLGNFKSSVAFQHKGMESRAFFVSVFASKLDHEDVNVLHSRVESRKRLAELYSRCERSPNDDHLQETLASYVNGMRFPHWFLPNISCRIYRRSRTSSSRAKGSTSASRSGTT
jgi:hypothetical protein